MTHKTLPSLRGLLAAVLIAAMGTGLVHAQDELPLDGPGQGGQCNTKPNFGCERGAWTLNWNREATIAALSKPATYRVCVWDPPKGNNDIALHVVLDGDLLTIPAGKGGERPMVLMPVLDTLQLPDDGASCVLLTGRTIKLVAAPSSSADRYPRGYYERLGPTSFTGQHRIETQPPEAGTTLYPITAARGSGVATKQLYRVCLGRFFGPTDERVSAVRTEVRADGTVIPMVNSSCVDVEAADIAGETWGPAGGQREPGMSGFVAF